MSAPFPSPYRVVHIPRGFAGVDPDTGNPKLVSGTPKPRYAQEIVLKASSDELDGDGEFVDRVASTLQMAVDDCKLYNTDDQVIVDGAIFGNHGNALVVTPDGTGSCTWTGGEAYWVDGVPDDQKGGPWPDLFKIFGGIVMLKRVT